MNLGIYQPPGAIYPDDETTASTKRKHAPLPAEEQTNKEGEAGNPIGNTLKRRCVEHTCSAREVATEQQNCVCCSRKLFNGSNLCRTCNVWAHWDCSMGCLKCAGWHCLLCWQLYEGYCPSAIRTTRECNWNRRSTSTTIRHPRIFASSGCTATCNVSGVSLFNTCVGLAQSQTYSDRDTAKRSLDAFMCAIPQTYSVFRLLWNHTSTSDDCMYSFLCAGVCKDFIVLYDSVITFAVIRNSGHFCKSCLALSCSVCCHMFGSVTLSIVACTPYGVHVTFVSIIVSTHRLYCFAIN
jgi:hypothetical protein